MSHCVAIYDSGSNSYGKITNGHQQASTIVQSPVQTNVAASITTVALLAANTARTGAVINNESASANLYVSFSGTSSLTAYTYKVPFGTSLRIDSAQLWLGAISGIWDAAVGTARITEFN